MPPQLISLGIFAIQQLIIHEPEIAAEIKALLTKADPTPAEWDALHAKIALKGYLDYVPASALIAAPVAVKVLPTVVPQADEPVVSGSADNAEASAVVPAPAPVGLNNLNTALSASLTPTA